MFACSSVPGAVPPARTRARSRCCSRRGQPLDVLAADPPEPQLPEIRVEGSSGDRQYHPGSATTATKTDTPLKEIPASLTIVPAQLIKDASLLSMGELLRYVPGVMMHQGEGNRDDVVLRGNRTNADFFINGIRDDAQVFRDVYNLERLEVLKGPAGVIFGRGGAGGVINRVTKRPVFGPGRRGVAAGRIVRPGPRDVRRGQPGQRHRRVAYQRRRRARRQLSRRRRSRPLRRQSDGDVRARAAHVAGARLRAPERPPTPGPRHPVAERRAVRHVAQPVLRQRRAEQRAQPGRQLHGRARPRVRERLAAAQCVPRRALRPVLPERLRRQRGQRREHADDLGVQQREPAHELFQPDGPREVVRHRRRPAHVPGRRRARPPGQREPASAQACSARARSGTCPTYPPADPFATVTRFVANPSGSDAKNDVHREHRGGVRPGPGRLHRPGQAARRPPLRSIRGRLRRPAHRRAADRPVPHRHRREPARRPDFHAERVVVLLHRVQLRVPALGRAARPCDDDRGPRAREGAQLRGGRTLGRPAQPHAYRGRLPARPRRRALGRSGESRLLREDRAATNQRRRDRAAGRGHARAGWSTAAIPTSTAASASPSTRERPRRRPRSFRPATTWVSRRRTRSRCGTASRCRRASAPGSASSTRTTTTRRSTTR